MQPAFVAVAFFYFLLLMILGLGIVRILAAFQTRMAIVNRVEQKLDLLLQHAGVKFDQYANPPPEVVEALKQGHKIKAIQLYGLKTGTGLKEAKEFIEELQQRTGPT